MERAILSGMMATVRTVSYTHLYYPKGTANGNNFPIMVGGGYRMDGATVMVLQKKGKEMTLRVLNAKGETLQDLKL